MRTHADDPSIIETRARVERVVIGPKLCPFAPAPALKGTIRYAVSEAGTPEALLEDLAEEAQRLAASPPDDIGNATNRSPYPTLHLLREAGIARAVEAFGDTRRISDDNVATLEAIGPEGLEAVLRGRMAHRPTTTRPPSRALSPKKLLHTKWTAVEPRDKEKRFLVTRVVEPVPPGSPVVSVEIEAVHSKRARVIAWRGLKDATRWKRGWV